MLVDLSSATSSLVHSEAGCTIVSVSFLDETFKIGSIYAPVDLQKRIDFFNDIRRRKEKLPRFGNKGGPRCLDSAARGGPRRRQKVSIHSAHFAPRSLLDGATTRETQRTAE